MRQASGDIYFADATSTTLIQSGAVDMAGKGTLQAAGTILTIEELGKPDRWGNLHLQLAGPISALAALSDTPPLRIAAKQGIRADALSGEAQLSLNGKVPLFEHGLDGLGADFRLALTDFSSSDPISGRQIEKADLVLEGDPTAFAVKGQGELDGLQASLDLMLGTATPQRAGVVAVLDDGARERLGFGLGSLLTGPIEASIERSGEDLQQVTLDLRNARLQIAALGWEKGVGVPATATFDLHKSESGTLVGNLVVSGRGFGAKGDVSLGPDGKLREISLRELALTPGDRLSLEAVAAGAGFDVTIRGDAFDARGLIKAATASSGSSSGGVALAISLDIRSVTGQNGAKLSNVAGSLRVGTKGLESASVKGATGRGKDFQWTLGRDDGARVLSLRAANAGDLIGFAGIYRKVADGKLTLDYRGTVGGAGTGVMVIQDFRLLNETALAPAVESAWQAANRVNAPAAATNTSDLHFTQLRVPFRQERWVIAIDNAALRGPMLGATSSGTVNLPGKRLALNGAFIPAFGLNNIAGSIPILGTILGGGRDEGLLGITYKLFGPIDAPKLAMNPISAIAPGIFRKIFEYR